MTSFTEHNNRKTADKYAEFITGEGLRRYVAEKVHKCVGKNVSVFDGAVGSGQLEQYIDHSFIRGVEIQSESCAAFLSNYDRASVDNMSFFNFKSDDVYDCAVMNPPFSIKIKDLSPIEIDNIKNEYPWKKSGVVDDIFILKSLNYTRRYGFYICFPGISYRRSELRLREIIGNNLAEINLIQGAFDDTPIDVLFIVVDKEKVGDTANREIYNCKSKKILLNDSCNIDPSRWELPFLTVKKEAANIDDIEREIQEMKEKRRAAEDELDAFVVATFKKSQTGGATHNQNNQFLLQDKAQEVGKSPQLINFKVNEKVKEDPQLDLF